MSTYQSHSDAELAHLLTKGDKAAFEAIYRRYAADLYRYARKNIAGKEDCEEIIQDIFESLWLRHATLHIETLQAYLIRMVRYKIIRYFQHSAVKRKYAEHYKFFETIYDTIAEETNDPTEIQFRLNKTISELPEKVRIAVQLRLNESLSNSDIAKRMNIPKKTVEWYMFKAFSHIRETYKPQQS